MKNKHLKETIQQHEESFQKIFCSTSDFSDTFKKNKNDEIPLMHDHHQFITKKQELSESDIIDAREYQKTHGYDFLKIDSRFPLSKELIEHFNLEESMTLTMVHPNKESLLKQLHKNPKVIVKDVQNSSIEQDLLAMDLKNTPADQAEFSKQFISAFTSKAKKDPRLHFLGAYLNDEICGYCICFDNGNLQSLDWLLVNEESRHQYVASSLMYYAADTSNSILYLHADANDTPKQMYQKLGFESIDTLYEYTLTGLKQI